MLVSMTLLLSFFTQFAHPFVETWLMQDTHRAEVYGEIFVMDAGGGGQIRLASTRHRCERGGQTATVEYPLRLQPALATLR
jgi:hypothetical protein